MAVMPCEGPYPGGNLEQLSGPPLPCYLSFAVMTARNGQRIDPGRCFLPSSGRVCRVAMFCAPSCCCWCWKEGRSRLSYDRDMGWYTQTCPPLLSTVSKWRKRDQEDSDACCFRFTLQKKDQITTNVIKLPLEISRK